MRDRTCNDCARFWPNAQIKCELGEKTPVKNCRFFQKIRHYPDYSKIKGGRDET